MANCTFTNLTQEQALLLAKWFEGQGEQDCVIWFEERGVKSPFVSIHRKEGHTVISASGDVTVYCNV
jgi:hypothetical protein